MRTFIKSVVLMFTAFALAGCATISGLPSIDKGIVNYIGSKAVPKNSELAVYSCWGATQELNGWKPILSTTRVWPDRVIVVDEGSQFTVDYPTAVIESPQLYSVVGKKVDIGINLTTATRYYKLSEPKLAYGTSTLTTDGDGVGMVFFNCSTDSVLIADPASVNVVKP